MNASQIIIIFCTIFNIFYLLFMLSKWKKILKKTEISIFEIREEIANEFLKTIERRKEENEIMVQLNPKMEKETKRLWESFVWEDRTLINILIKNKNLFPEEPLEREDENE